MSPVLLTNEQLCHGQLNHIAVQNTANGMLGSHRRGSEMNDSTSLDVEAVSTVDPITVSVIQHRLSAIVEEMGEAMLRTS